MATPSTTSPRRSPLRGASSLTRLVLTSCSPTLFTPRRILYTARSHNRDSYLPVLCKGRRVSSVKPPENHLLLVVVFIGHVDFTVSPFKGPSCIPPPTSSPVYGLLFRPKNVQIYLIGTLYALLLSICRVTTWFYRELVSIMQSHDGGWWRQRRGRFKHPDPLSWAACSYLKCHLESFLSYLNRKLP